ncbi:MAG: hypothetical protein M3T55_10065 [Pseudomonadota bacterium]|nr:hypothetical protein [Pseudomonadota bacterium]
MPDEKPLPVNPDTAISKEEFARRDEELTKALDELEKKALPAKGEPAEIDGMIGS